MARNGLEKEVKEGRMEGRVKGNMKEDSFGGRKVAKWKEKSRRPDAKIESSPVSDNSCLDTACLLMR